MWRHGPLRRVTAAALLSWQVLGCYSWRTQHMEPQQVLASHQGERVRLDVWWDRFEVRNVALADDSVRGEFLVRTVSDRSWATYEPRDVQGIAVADVTRVQVRKVNGVRTGLAILAGLVVLGGVGAAIALSTMDWSGGGTYGGGSYDGPW